MGKIILLPPIAALALGCGPEVHDDGDGPPGVLEYEIPTNRFYRLDRRLDIVGVDPMVDRSGCGLLTDRAYDDLMDTLDALDPHQDYDQAECFADFDPDGLLYIQGFTHSPFRCNWYCCNEELLQAVIVHWAALSNLWGQGPNIDGEIYVALEPDVPCPD
jgi:hypothetical protein